jgi:hypothetical protein
MVTGLGLLSIERPSAKVYKTAGGRSLHLAPCPHIHACAVSEATDADLAEHEICKWSQAELDGVGRVYFTTLEDAMRAFHSYSETWATIKHYVAQVEYDQIWIPNSQAYVAVGLRGQTVAWFGKTILGFQDGSRVEMPGYESWLNSGHVTAAQKQPQICQRCFVAMPLTGRCVSCE